jgi:integrase
MKNNSKVHTPTGRAQLKARREPYWDSIEPGLGLGFRKHKEEHWIARFVENGTRQGYSIGRVSGRLADWKEARADALKWKAQLDAGVVAHGKTTVTDACKAYVENRLMKRGKTAARHARVMFEREVYKHKLGDMLLDKVTTAQLDRWLHELVEPTDGSPGVQKQSANRYWTWLAAALNRAVLDKKVTKERATEWENVEIYKDAREDDTSEEGTDGGVVNKRREIFLDKGQRCRLRDAATGPVRDLIEAVMLTGCRPGELATLRRSRFDQNIGAIKLKRSKIGKFEDVLLIPDAVTLFKRLARRSIDAKAFLLVKDDKGTPWREDWHREVRGAVRQAGLPVGKKGKEGVSLYSLRHSWIAEALQNGIAVSVVAFQVGTSAAMIQENYNKYIKTHVAPQLAALNQVLV